MKGIKHYFTKDTTCHNKVDFCFLLQWGISKMFKCPDFALIYICCTNGHSRSDFYACLFIKLEKEILSYINKNCLQRLCTWSEVLNFVYGLTPVLRFTYHIYIYIYIYIYQYLLKPTNCTYLSNHLKPHNWIKMDLKYLLHVSIPLWDHPQGA